jgi:serine/threonine-protein kinase
MKECPSCHRCFQDQVNHCPGDGERLKFLVPLDTVLDERYQVERKLGQGGMGLVFKAHHKFIKTQHAIKVILPDLVGNDPSLVARFRQEAMAAAAIRHPNTVSVTDYGILNDTTPYLVMEFVDGISLHDLLVREKHLPPAEAVEIMLAVCAGVAAAHRQGIVHRDLKPLNIMLRPGEPPGEAVKVLDFGLAKIKSGELLGSLVAAQTQGMMGSPFYMAPEQWHDDEIDVRADIYSLGVILYQMLAGDVPFKGKSIPSIMNMHLNTPPVPLSERGIEVPEPLERAVRHALEKDPARRPQSVREFMDELRAAMPSLGDIHTTREPGMQTVHIERADTQGLADKIGAQTGADADSPDVLKTVASTPDALARQEIKSDSGATVADSSSRLDTDGGAAQRTSEVVPQAQTVGRVAGEGALRPSNEAMTEPLPQSGDVSRAEEERLRAEALRRQQEEEEQRAREAELLRRREAEERERREAEERQRREAEEQQRREAQERARREAEDRARREAEERAAAFAAQQAALAEQQRAEAQRQAELRARQQQQSAEVLQDAGQTSDVITPAPSRVLPIVIGGAAALVLLAAVAAALVYFVVLPRMTNTNADNSNAVANTNANTNSGSNTNARGNTNNAANANANSGPARTTPALVQLAGGTFRMGRDDVPLMSDELKARRPQYLLWMYNQWPAHNVTVGPFAIDRTEVTNAEYAEFVKETGHQPPPRVWDGVRPKAGEEQFPVSNVSYEDARAFAEWRSRRDHATYRLPTEEEWEFAARGGDSLRLYPWGAEWADGRANLGTDSLRPVGSFPLGNTPQGLADMIGNVWEWTSTEAAMYKGNDKTALDPKDRGKLVIRGGSYGPEYRPDGDKPITATSRAWVARDTRDTHLGFRLVRVGP